MTMTHKIIQPRNIQPEEKFIPISADLRLLQRITRLWLLHHAQISLFQHAHWWSLLLLLACASGTTRSHGAFRAFFLYLHPLVGISSSCMPSPLSPAVIQALWRRLQAAACKNYACREGRRRGNSSHLPITPPPLQLPFGSAWLENPWI